MAAGGHGGFEEIQRIASARSPTPNRYVFPAHAGLARVRRRSGRSSRRTCAARGGLGALVGDGDEMPDHGGGGGVGRRGAPGPSRRLRPRCRDGPGAQSRPRTGAGGGGGDGAAVGRAGHRAAQASGPSGAGTTMRGELIAAGHCFLDAEVAELGGRQPAPDHVALRAGAGPSRSRSAGSRHATPAAPAPGATLVREKPAATGQPAGHLLKRP